MHGAERDGVPAEWAGDGREARENEPQRTMSCGLCGHLQRAFGPPPYSGAAAARSAAAGARLDGMRDAGNGWWNEWDMHAFGAWAARNAFAHDRCETAYRISALAWDQLCKRVTRSHKPARRAASRREALARHHCAFGGAA